MKLNWNVDIECPGCDQQITVDISKKSATCPRCGDIKITGNAAAETKKAEQAFADFDRSLQELSKKLGK